MPNERPLVGRAEFKTMRDALDFITGMVERTHRKYRYSLRKVQDMVTNKVTFEVEWQKREN